MGCGTGTGMSDLVFFYGTLMTPFRAAGRLPAACRIEYAGRGAIKAALFDLGLYPAAVPAEDSQVTGEVCRMTSPPHVLRVLDDFEGFRPADPETSLYRRALTAVVLEDNTERYAWVYFYNAPLGRAPRIVSGDYLAYLGTR